MSLRSIHADRLRNLRSVHVPLTSGITLVTGPNGHGKTSFLEAVYLLGTGYSFRTRKTDELVDRSGGPLKVVGEITGPAADTVLSLVVDQGEKRLFVDGASRPLDEFLGRLDLVALSNEGMHALRGAPELRRRFLDGGIAGLCPAFLVELGTYRRVLAERNALLRRGGPIAAELSAWDDRLAIAGARVHRRRREHLVGIASRIGPAERMLFPDGEQLAFRYKPSPAEAEAEDPARYETVFRESLERRRRRDQALGFTGEGPHRDDCEVTLNGADLKAFGSSGQHRAAMIALCAGKLGLLKDQRRGAPLFLVDDFDSDLDERRTRSLVEFLREGGYQAILATSKDGFLDRLGASFQRIRMEGGWARAA